jgi:predicted DNA binding protein
MQFPTVLNKERTVDSSAASDLGTRMPWREMATQVVKIRFDIERNIISEVSSQKNAKIRVLRCVPNKDGGGKSLLRIDVDEAISSDEVIRWFKESDPTIEAVGSSISPGRHILIVSNPSCRICQVFSRSNCLLESGHSLDGGSLIWNIVSPDPDSLRGFIKDLRANGGKVELMKVKRLCPLTELTKEQDAMIRSAYASGYFDMPKRITLEELATQHHMSKSTMNLVLRRAQRKIFSKYLGIE